MNLPFSLSERAKTNLRRFVLYPLWFLFCFVTFAYCTFPYDRVRDRIEDEVERAMPGAELDIVDLSPSWITGVELTGVSLTLPAEEEGERPTALTLTTVTARVGLLDLIGGTTSVGFYAELGGGGTIEGRYSDGETSTQVQAHLVDVALQRIGPLRRYVQLPIAGTLGGDIDVTIADEAANTEGQVTLTIAGLSVGDGRARLEIPGMRGTGITVEQLNAGDLNLRMQIERGVGRVQQLTSSSDDLELRGAGTVRLLRPLRMSNVDVILRFEIKQPYRERNDRTRAIFTMVDMAPDVRAYRAPDGAFQLRVAGSFGSSIRASGAGNATLAQ
ncbi:type II secretion system protein GspN [Sandaracinus amylolyticus]|uniref:General secretion pathway protein N n=1 Tax=Sandaracinus amylolyticus TaxID=927083 RepID=A0A0F6SDR9_9BACT|nr:type II secretion system protein GspN [Sandaracinus amylolyticus]AKF03924.1 General secretion pathway protein N [Sandaracinus amylolyticus]